MLLVKEFKGMGRGLVTTKYIPAGTVFHCADVLELNRRDSKIVDKTMLAHYVYDLGHGRSGLALGFGSLFNHSDIENVSYQIKTSNGRKYIIYTTLIDVKVGEQLFINYGWLP